MRDSFLFKLYHPSGLSHHASEGGARNCPCGCVESTKVLGDGIVHERFYDTIGMREERALKRSARKLATVYKEIKASWKGATIEHGHTVKIVDKEDEECLVSNCEEEHAFAKCKEDGRYIFKRLHKKRVPAVAYTLENGARILWRADAAPPSRWFE